MDTVAEMARAVEQSGFMVVLTGAGASTESGLPDFRSKAGLWQQIDPFKLASMTALHESPVEFYQFYRHRLSRLYGASPNMVHHALAALQQAGYLKALITQNIDGLHQTAGSTGVIEVHGSLREAVCLNCECRFSSDLLDREVTSRADLPRCPQCRGLLKPGVILFKEPLPEEAVEMAIDATERADLFLVIGSSLEVGPINRLPAMAAHLGADLAIINLEATHLDGVARWVVQERASQVLSQLCARLGISY